MNKYLFTFKIHSYKNEFTIKLIAQWYYREEDRPKVISKNGVELVELNCSDKVTKNEFFVLENIKYEHKVYGSFIMVIPAERTQERKEDVENTAKSLNKTGTLLETSTLKTVRYMVCSNNNFEFLMPELPKKTEEKKVLI